MISVVIPSYKDPLLQKTIDSLLENAEGDIEVIPVLDGYWPEIPLKDDPRVRILHLGKNQGMRNAINCGVRIARGEFIMRTDEHAIFGPGYDRILTERFKDNWIVTPVRYYLDTEQWKVMDIPPNVYNKLIIDESRPKFSGVNWPSREKERPDKMIDETMAMQGSCWIMKKSWWDKVIVELQSEGYGTHYGDSHEMVFKTWKAGGKLMVNKNTWHAHKHRDFPRTHNYSSEMALPGWKYSLSLWREYYEKEIAPKWGLVKVTDDKIGKVYIDKFARKLKQFNHEMQLPAYFGPMIGEKKSVVIAELAAGPINTIGNTWSGVEVKVVPSDILQPEYESLWTEHEAVPLVPVQFQNMEKTTYEEETFDIVHCVNALDHTPDPMKAIEEMWRILKPGGWIYLRHSPYQRKRFGGHHHWDIYMENGICVFQSKDISFELENFEVKTEFDGNEDLIVATCQKI